MCWYGTSLVVSFLVIEMVGNVPVQRKLGLLQSNPSSCLFFRWKVSLFYEMDYFFQSEMTPMTPLLHCDVRALNG